MCLVCTGVDIMGFGSGYGTEMWSARDFCPSIWGCIVVDIRECFAHGGMDVPRSGYARGFLPSELHRYVSGYRISTSAVFNSLLPLWSLNRRGLAGIHAPANPDYGRKIGWKTRKNILGDGSKVYPLEADIRDNLKKICGVADLFRCKNWEVTRRREEIKLLVAS